MARGTIPHISFVIINFDEVKRYDDHGIVNHLTMTFRLSRKRILPKSVRYNSARVNRVTVHLYLGDKESARVSFIPGPDFSRMQF
jgi:hypothetical protein